MANDFRTTHIYVASVLLELGVELKDVVPDTNNPRMSVFVFKDIESIDRIVDDFWGHKLLLDPLNCFNHEKNLKNRIAELRNATRSP